MAVTAIVVGATAAVASAGYSVAQSQSAMHAAHGAQNKADAERDQLMKSLSTPQESEAEAVRAAQQRKKDYANLGQSSTILTGPGGLGSSGQSGQKTLLGY